MPLFDRWGTAHLTAIALTLIVPALLALIARGDSGGGIGRAIGYGFAALLLVQEISKFLWVRATFVRTWYEVMPLHLCDMALFACVVACLTRRQLAFEMAYFWGLAGTLEGLLTPDLAYDFPTLHFWFFFVGHGGIIASVLFLCLGLGLRPHWISVLRGFIGVLLYAVVVGIYNTAFGTNFGYLCGPPGVPSLIDFLGPWPWYIGVLALIGLLNFTLLYLPWALADRLTRPRAVAR